MMEVQVLGSGSNITKHIIKAIGMKNCQLYSSSKQSHSPIKKFFLDNKKNSLIIILSFFKDSLEKNIIFLNKIIKLSEKNNCKIIYISSINAKNPNASYYSHIKNKCEKLIINSGNSIVRFGLVISDKPFGAFASLTRITKLPIFAIQFPKKTVIKVTKAKEIEKFNFFGCKSKIQEIVSYDINLNSLIKLIDKKYYKKIKINISFLVYILKKINNRLWIKGLPGRLLTLCAFETN
jgi:hypothetical protein